MRKNYTKEERKTMIVTVFAIAIQNGDEHWLTPYQIAKRIGMTNCPSFRVMLNDLWGDCVLIKKHVNKPGKWSGFLYSLTPGTFQEPPHRTIAVKINGKPAEQLELWS